MADDIVCAVDFSPASEKAAEWAATIALATSARLHLLHVVPLPMPIVPVPEIGLGMESVVPATYDLTATARSSLAALAGELGLEAEVHVTTGNAAAEIVRFAGDAHAGMIVVGSHGHSRLERLLLGSVAERVVRLAHRPVLVVPDRKPH